MIKKLLPYLLIPTALLLGAAGTKLSQIKGKVTGPTIVVSLADGSLTQSSVLSGISVDASGNISIAPAALSIPTLAIFKIGTTPQSSFAIPGSKSTCDVFNSILLNPGEDYNTDNGQVVFIPGPNFPAAGDTIQLRCY